MPKKTKRKSPSPKMPKPSFDVPRRKTLRVGRNQPCPCGSGKKYKECHEADGDTFLMKLADQKERERRKRELKESGAPWYKRIFS
jgi:hypothetical protein